MTRKAYVIHSESRCSECCARDFSPSVEVYELTGELVCVDCADEVLEWEAAKAEEDAQ
jgi:hypothetical protein